VEPFRFVYGTLEFRGTHFGNRWTKLVNKKNTKTHHAKRKQTVSEHWNKRKHNGKITDRCTQRVSLCHIGLVKDSGGHLVNQPL